MLYINNIISIIYPKKIKDKKEMKNDSITI